MKSKIEEIKNQFTEHAYMADDALTTSVVLMENLSRPLLLEGEAGVGKTEVAKILAKIKDTKLIRLQCYEGLDTNAAVYEWNYSKQLLSIKLAENTISKEIENIFSREYLLERPLLQSICETIPPVLLIDEVDRADEAFEAFLLELLSDFQISIPELGTIQALSKPLVILTSNNTRDLSDALRRRCLYHYVDFPEHEKELSIIRSKVKGIDEKLSEQIVTFVQALRQQELRKRPGVAETLDWAVALTGLQVNDLFQHINTILETRTCLLKNQEDMALIDKQKTETMLQGIA